MCLFELGDFKLHSGKTSNFKIECEALSLKSLATLCILIADRYKFGKVVGVPTGGVVIERLLEEYYQADSEKILIVDDVLTTGGSMEEVREQIETTYPNRLIQGVVLFARGKCPDWVVPVFQMW